MKDYKIDSIVKFRTLTYTEEEQRIFTGEVDFTKSYECFSFSNNSFNTFNFNQKGLIDEIKIEKSDDFINSGILSILDFKIGDNEQKLKEKFPLSCKYIDYLREYFRDKKGIYSIEVKFIDEKGYLVFYLKEGLITSIEVDFIYR